MLLRILEVKRAVILSHCLTKLLLGAYLTTQHALTRSLRRLRLDLLSFQRTSCFDRRLLSRLILNYIVLTLHSLTQVKPLFLYLLYLLLHCGLSVLKISIIFEKQIVLPFYFLAQLLTLHLNALSLFLLTHLSIGEDGHFSALFLQVLDQRLRNHILIVF